MSARTTRRLALLGAAAVAAPALPAAVAAAHPDAELLRLCAEAEAAWLPAASLTDDVPDDEWSAIVNRHGAAVEAASRLVARTPQGLRAQASVVLDYIGEEALPENERCADYTDAMAFRILRGIAGRGPQLPPGASA